RYAIEALQDVCLGRRTHCGSGSGHLRGQDKERDECGRDGSHPKSAEARPSSAVRHDWLSKVQSMMPAGVARRVLLTAAFAVSCGPSLPSLRVSAAPSPILVHLLAVCGIGPATCGLPRLQSNWNVEIVETGGVGGRGTVSILVVDAVTRDPLPTQEGD